MSSCWATEAAARPSFVSIYTSLQQIGKWLHMQVNNFGLVFVCVCGVVCNVFLQYVSDILLYASAQTL